MFTIGIDIGSSSVKVSILDLQTGRAKGSASVPKNEMPIIAEKIGWAEQNPEEWWSYLKSAIGLAKEDAGITKKEIKAIGISYQMHGLVLVDKQHKLLRNSIIWCDSRATEIGNKALKEIGESKCYKNLLNSPGNFTASKLKWVQINEPDIYKKIHKIMLPGDYIANKLTGVISTTAIGLSEGIFWDMLKNKPAEFLLDYYSIAKEILPELVPVFGNQGNLTKAAAEELGLSNGIPVTYRAGDQPNNAFSLKVLEPGEIAATAGTSGVVYGVSDVAKYDKKSRVNTFLHVNHLLNKNRFGVLLCLNGAGILYSWLKKLNSAGNLSYEQMNEMAESVKPGSEGLKIFPFGNGAERMLLNQNKGCAISGLNFNVHNSAHLFRAGLEGVVYSFKYGIDILKETGINPTTIRAGNSNLFLSKTFREMLATVTNTKLEIFDTDGALGAARGAAYGAKLYKSINEVFSGLTLIKENIPVEKNKKIYKSLYQKWLFELENNY